MQHEPGAVAEARDRRIHVVEQEIPRLCSGRVLWHVEISPEPDAGTLPVTRSCQFGLGPQGTESGMGPIEELGENRLLQLGQAFHYQPP